MKCPKCHQELIKSIDREFETLSDHICNPFQEHYPLRPTYECNNIQCPASMDNIFWDEDGVMYGWDTEIWFDNGLSSAYPSRERKMDIEIYKKGLKSNLRLHPCLMLWFLQPMIKFTYKADEYGNVLKRGYKLIWLRKDNWKPWVKDRFGYHIRYFFPIMMIIRHIKGQVRVLRNCSETYKQSAKKKLLEPLASWDERWWRKVEKWLDRNIFYKLY